MTIPCRSFAGLAVTVRNGRFSDRLQFGLCGSPGLTVEMSALRSEADVTGFASYFCIGRISDRHILGAIAAARKYDALVRCECLLFNKSSWRWRLSVLRLPDDAAIAYFTNAIRLP